MLLVCTSFLYLYREERGKVDVKFTINFKKETKYPLRPLYEQIARDYLGNMPVYRDTLIRGGTRFAFHLLFSYEVYCTDINLFDIHNFLHYF